MNSRPRLFFYILLNIFISALVTGAIIFFYNRLYHKDCSATIPGDTSGTPSASGINIAISGINGTGTLASEALIIQNNGSSALVLTGWTLKNNQGSTYTFPQLTLFSGGIVEVHTKSGSDTASDLFWQLSASVWASGDLAALYDTQNIARAFYRVP